MEFGKLGGAGVEVTQFPEKLGDQSYVWDRQELPIVNWDVGEIEAVLQNLNGEYVGNCSTNHEQ